MPTNAALAARLRSIREEWHGDDDGRAMADRLALPHRTWLNYERGVTIPGQVLLRFIALTGVDAAWLLDGEGGRYR